MDGSDESTAKTAVALPEDEPSKSQHLGHHGRPNNPPWRKVIVYDCEEQTVKVTSEKNISRSRASSAHAPD